MDPQHHAIILKLRFQQQATQNWILGKLILTLEFMKSISVILTWPAQ